MTHSAYLSRDAIESSILFIAITPAVFLLLSFVTLAGEHQQQRGSDNRAGLQSLTGVFCVSVTLDHSGLECTTANSSFSLSTMAGISTSVAFSISTLGVIINTDEPASLVELSRSVTFTGTTTEYEPTGSPIAAT